MQSAFAITGPDGTLQLFGIRMIGLNGANLRKLLLTVVFLFAMWLLARLLRAVMRLFLRGREDVRARFWSEQGVHLVVAILTVIVIVSIWFSNPARIASAASLVSAALAIALQKVVLSVAGYVVILRSRVFNIGDRIKMGGVRGDVIALGFVRTTIMEMGQPPDVAGQEDPGMWVEARQYTGRIVTVTNDKIFDEAVYNYTRAFPFLWEEMRLPIRYTADRKRAEEILLESARRHSLDIKEIGEEKFEQMARRFYLRPHETTPRVYYRLTDNWLELAVRFLVREHGVRDVKDAMSREILGALEEAKIEVASATFEIVGTPTLRIEK